MKPIRHMTLEQYKGEIVPKIVELKKILRKKYMHSAEYSGLLHLPFEKYVDYKIEQGRDRAYFNVEYIRSTASKEFFRLNLKTDPIPPELYEQYCTIYNELSKLYIDQKYVDLSKAHKDHKAEIRRAIDKDVYVQELKDGLIKFEELEAVCGSVGVRIPKRVYQLKENIQAGMYERGFLKANAEFLKSIRDYMTPYIDRLKSVKRDQIMRWVEVFEEQPNNLYRFWVTQKDARDIFSELLPLFGGGERTRVPNFEEKLERKCSEYAEDFIGTFIARLENKVNKVNLAWGVPKIEFTSEGNYLGGELNTQFKLDYENGETITGDSKVIIAGGDLVVMHQRYLFHFWHNGKNVSLEQMDQLKLG